MTTNTKDPRAVIELLVGALEGVASMSRCGQLDEFVGEAWLNTVFACLAAAKAAQTEPPQEVPDWSNIGALINAANSASAAGLLSGTSNWAAHVSRMMRETVQASKQGWRLNTPEIVEYVTQYGGRCRDCADENGVCPNNGLPCKGYRIAIKHVLSAVDYGLKHEFISAAPSTGDQT